jgi:hypothetical protein
MILFRKELPESEMTSKTNEAPGITVERDLLNYRKL